MGAHEDIKAGLDMNQIAGLLGTDEQTAESAVDQALSSLVSQMSGNVDDESGATALARALGVAPSAVDLLQGATSREKLLRVEGDPATLVPRLESLA